MMYTYKSNTNIIRQSKMITIHIGYISSVLLYIIYSFTIVTYRSKILESFRKTKKYFLRKKTEQK